MIYVINKVVIAMEEYNKNWRSSVGKKRNPKELDWRIHKHYEFVKFAEAAEDLSELYDWNFWGGGVDNLAVTLSQPGREGLSISIRLLSDNHYSYYVSFANQWNPNNIEYCEYTKCIADNLDDALEYLHTFLKENPYQREYKDDRISVMGGAYERFPLALKWAYEELEDNNEGNLYGVKI